jgi:flagellin
MALSITTNVSSLNAQRNLSKSQGDLQTSFQRLSSGLRINGAKDDAAGLAISNRFTTQVRGLNVAVRNANDGISFAQTTEGALTEVSTALQRIRDLAVQSANDTNSSSDRESLQAEVSQLVSEIDRISSTTEFNGTAVLNGSKDSLNFHIGANANQTISVSGVDARSSALGSQPGAVQTTTDSVGNTAGTALSGATFTITAGGGDTVDALSTANGGNVNTGSAADLANTSAVDYGSGQAKNLADRINTLRSDGVAGTDGIYATATTTYDYNDAGVSTANSANANVGAGTLANGGLTINGVDVGPVNVLKNDSDGALTTAINAKSDVTGVAASINTDGQLVLTADDGRDILVDTAAAADADVLFGGGTADAFAATNLTADLKVGEVTISAQDTLTLGAGFLNTDTADDNQQAVGAIANADVTTVSGSNITIESVDSALAQVNSFRADLGAVQNRFESTIRNLSSVSESLSAANSRILDADFASETAALSKNQVLQQAGISVLAQANALPQQALSLLG